MTGVPTTLRWGLRNLLKLSESDPSALSPSNLRPYRWYSGTLEVLSSDGISSPNYRTHWLRRQELPWCSGVILVLLIHLWNVGRPLLCCVILIPRKWPNLRWHGCRHVVWMLPASVGIRRWEHPLLSGEKHRPLLIRRDNPRRGLSSFPLC